jgi:hypothetical protein
VLERLARAIQNRRMVLFAGSGLSASLGLPTWNGLMRQAAEELGYDADVLINPDANYLQVAEFYNLEKGSIGPLKSWMDRSFHVEEKRLRESAVHNQIVDLNFPLIYTTNYDRNIERVFGFREKPYSKVVSVFDVAEASPTHTHIVKFHGDFDVEDSLVLTESDYFKRLDFESPMDIKLRADILGRGVLFVGYSLSDLNLRVLLYRMDKLWASSKFASKRPESFIFLLRPNPVQEAVLRSRGVQAIVYQGDNPDKALEEMFTDLIDTIRLNC